MLGCVRRVRRIARRLAALSRPPADLAIDVRPDRLSIAKPRMIEAAERDHGLARCLVMAIFGRCINEFGHVRASNRKAQDGIYRFGSVQTGRAAERRQ
jgi:hypothetical protein